MNNFQIQIQPVLAEFTKSKFMNLSTTGWLLQINYLIITYN